MLGEILPDLVLLAIVLAFILSTDAKLTAAGRAQALATASSFEPDVLVLDIGLPDLSGYELAKHARAAPWGQRVVLVAVTGWGQEEDRRRAFEAGFDHHLTKPIEAEKLERLLHSVAESMRGASKAGIR